MKKPDKVIFRIKYKAALSHFNFKSAIIIYLICAIVVGISSIGFLVYTFRDKLTFAYLYNRVNERIERNKSGIEEIKPDLMNLANNSQDIVDILVLDSGNSIIYSAKNSSLAHTGTFELIGNNDRERHYLIDKANPNVIFRLVKNDDLLLSKAMIFDDRKMEHGYNDDYFYESNFNAKSVYLLSYITDKASGNKIYFISDIQPVANAEFYLKAVLSLGILFFMIYWVLTALWVYANALKSKLNAPIWGIITLFTNLAGLFIYLIYKQGNQTCYKCGAVQNKMNIYCTSCGTKIVDTCANCNAAISDSDQYCRNCGNKLNQKSGNE